MAVLKIKLNNILCFNDFEADFSYPKKIVNNPLEYEYLKDYPKLRYKKVNILIGSNATGKTSLGRAIWMTFRFLSNKEGDRLKELVSNPNKESHILMDSVFSNGKFFRLEVKILTTGEILTRYIPIVINKQDTYESIEARIDKSKPFNNYVVELQNADMDGWFFLYPTIETGLDYIWCKQNEKNEKDFLEIYENVLKTFDSSIKSVIKSKEQNNSYVINVNDGRTVRVTDGETLSGLKGLSSGTKYAVNVATLMCAIKNHDNGFYYVDEQFSYVNSEIEVACLSSMIALLGDGEQLFLTTHNANILSMPLPNHAFNFLKKEKDERGIDHITLINVSDFEKRNNVNPKNLYDNDYFDVFPNIDNIIKIGEA